MNRKKIQVPVPMHFESLKVYDDRYIRVKIWMMHLGANRNGSYFSKDVVERAIPTLVGNPILGYPEFNGVEDDFTDHRSILVREDGEYKIRYIGQAFGYIPEDNNAQFEFREGSDGIVREYLTCEGIIWNKWDYVTDILERDKNKVQSMELSESVYSGFYGEDGFYHFTNFEFFGACILGNDVLPAMDGASIELMFANSNMKEDMQKHVHEFESLYSFNKEDQQKKGENMNKQLQALLTKFSLTEDNLKAVNFNLEDYKTEDELTAKIEEIAKDVTPDPITEPEVNTEPVVDVTQYTAQIETLEAEVGRMKVDHEAVLKTVTEERDSFKTQFEALSTEVEELRQFKTEADAKELQAQESALDAQFEGQLSKDEIEAVKAENVGLSFQAIEDKLYALVGRKARTNFSATPRSTGLAKTPVHIEQHQTGTDIEDLIAKHIK